MKTIGIIGGMSYESTITYYQLINDYVRNQLGGLHSAHILLDSLEFSAIEALQASNQWDKAGDILANSAAKLEQAGADVILIATNTMHKVADSVIKAINVPLLHIADATADVMESMQDANGQKVTKVALLGTRYTMTQDFYIGRLQQRGFAVLTPQGEDIDLVNNVIFHELCVGTIKDESRQAYKAIIDKLKEQGAQAVILGCTEIGLLISEKDSSLPVLDTTQIHAQKAAAFALQD